jgi:hypothetical protein
MTIITTTSTATTKQNKQKKKKEQKENECILYNAIRPPKIFSNELCV